MFKKMFNWINGLFKAEKGSPSSKRFIGILCGITLCITLYANSYTHGDIKPADTLVNAVAMLAFGCLGLASVDKIWGKKDNDKTEE
jgi:ABC-type transport system involved in cytochrome c biogenesis permease subunit